MKNRMLLDLMLPGKLYELQWEATALGWSDRDW